MDIKDENYERKNPRIDSPGNGKEPTGRESNFEEVYVFWAWSGKYMILSGWHPSVPQCAHKQILNISLVEIDLKSLYEPTLYEGRTHRLSPHMYDA